MSLVNSKRLWVMVAGTLIALALAVGTTTWFAREARTQEPKTQTIRILGLNDFHGNLNTPSTTPSDPDPRGGAGYLDAYLDKFEKINPRRTIRVHAGDMVGASPLVSSYFHDEPAILATNMMGFDVGTIGNHEFDEGGEEMLRLINGGRRTGPDARKTNEDGEQVNTSMKGYPGASYPYISANVVYKDDRSDVLPQYRIVQRKGVKVGFIGVTTEETPAIVVPDAVEPFKFLDISDSVNRNVRKLQNQGVETIVVLAHAGGSQTSAEEATGEIIDEASEMSDAVDVVVAGHTHSTLNTVVDGKLVVESEPFGQQFNSIKLGVDQGTGDVVSKSARTVDTFTEGVRPSGDIQSFVDDYNERIAPIQNRVVGNAPETLFAPRNQATPDGESDLGNLIADAQRYVAGADIAFMNPGGIRANIDADGPPSDDPATSNVTFGEIFTVQPFDNGLSSGELTGAQIEDLLEQQFPPNQPNNSNKILQPSGIEFTYDTTRPAGDRITSITVGDAPIDPNATYTVAANSFLITGGDNFTVFRDAENVQSFGSDIDALEQYIDEVLDGQIVAPENNNRITRTN